MIVYQITNRINGKVYIGITNNAKKRWGNHCCNKKSLIGRMGNRRCKSMQIISA